jgi:hypothetical protein
MIGIARKYSHSNGRHIGPVNWIKRAICQTAADFIARLKDDQLDPSGGQAIKVQSH